MAKRQSSSPSFETLLQSCRDVAAEQQGSAPSVLSVPVPSVPVLSMEWLKAAEQQMSSLPRGQLTQRRPGTAPHAPSGHRAPEQAQAHRERTRETAGGGGGEEWGGERLLREEVGEVGDVDDGDGEEEGFEEGGWMDELFAIGTVLSEEEMMQRARSALRSALRCHGAAIFLVRGEGPGAAVVCNSPLSPAVQLASRQGLVAMLARGECGGEVQEMTAGAGLDPAPWGEEEQTRLLAVACLDPSSRVRAVLLASRPGSRTCGAGSGAGVDAEGGRTGRPEHGGAFPPEAHGRARLLARQAGMLLALAEQGRVGEVRERESEPAARLQ
ncbi:hypothetical protein T484DRAFT_1799351, partial [Baffinella frigidus]